MPEEPYTNAELEAACKAVHELEDMTVDRYLSVKLEVAAAFRAVLPDHDARVRADERARVAEEITELRQSDRPEGVTWDRGWYDALTAAATSVRTHPTTPEEDQDG